MHMYDCSEYVCAFSGCSNGAVAQEVGCQPAGIDNFWMHPEVKGSNQIEQEIVKTAEKTFMEYHTILSLITSPRGYMLGYMCRWQVVVFTAGIYWSYWCS